MAINTARCIVASQMSSTPLITAASDRRLRMPSLINIAAKDGHSFRPADVVSPCRAGLAGESNRSRGGGRCATIFGWRTRRELATHERQDH